MKYAYDEKALDALSYKPPVNFPESAYIPVVGDDLNLSIIRIYQTHQGSYSIDVEFRMADPHTAWEYGKRKSFDSVTLKKFCSADVYGPEGLRYDMLILTRGQLEECVKQAEAYIDAHFMELAESHVAYLERELGQLTFRIRLISERMKDNGKGNR